MTKSQLLPSVAFVDWGRQRTASKHRGCDIDFCASERVANLVLQLPLGGFRFSYTNLGNVGSIASQVPGDDSNYAYELKIRGNQITLAAMEEWGGIAGVSTLAQLLVSFDQNLVDCIIRDHPVLPWRGLMIDVARHFISLSTLRTTCDLMHYYKLNVLHLHLTDDQGFRYGCESFPKLVSHQHYTKGELQDLVQYAADRGIRVVPEIDMPAHTASWIFGYPQWAVGEFDASSCKRFGPHRECLDPSNAEVMKAVASILTEVAETFPDACVHVGGDEVDPTWWDESNRVQQWARQHRLQDAADIQNFFLQRVMTHLNSLQKKPIVWDDALHQNLSEDVVVQAWRGLNAREQSVNAGHATIVSSPYYLDLNYTAATHSSYHPNMSRAAWEQQDLEHLQKEEIAHVRDGVDWQQSFGRYPPLDNRPNGRVVGGEACMWSELVSDETLLTRVWTRMPVIAERLWSGVRDSTESEMYERLQWHVLRSPKIGFPEVYSLTLIHPCRHLDPLFEMLEPVKWYARHLTLAGVHARVRGEDFEHPRPYSVDSPLTRIVDRLPVESFAVLKCRRHIRQKKPLDQWISGWRAQAQAFDSAVTQYPELEELHDVSKALDKLANIADGSEDFVERLAEPYGEYLLPIAHEFRYS